MNDFDVQAARQEHEDESKEAAELALCDIRRFAKIRCCLFLGDEDAEILHGRMVGIMQELDTVIIRDLRPGREILQAHLQVPYESIFYACHSNFLEKCKRCPEYQEMQRQAKHAGAREPLKLRTKRADGRKPRKKGRR